MQTTKNKALAIVIAIILVSTAAISLNSPQATNAEVINGYNYDAATTAAIHAGMYWNGMGVNASATRLLLFSRFNDNISTTVFIVSAPNPVGVGQTCNFVFFNPQVPPNALPTVPSARYSYTIDVTTPSGIVQHFPTASQSVAAQTGGNAGVANGQIISDSTGSTYMAYTPDAAGNYSVTVHFIGFRYLWNSTFGSGSNDYYGTYFNPASYTATLTVQNEPVAPIDYPDILPMPTQYWTRPIEGQNTNWYQFSSNWLHNAHDYSNEAGAQNRFQPDGIAPNSPHILWTRPTEDNGILGGTNDGRDGVGNAFNAGSQYQPRFNTAQIMYGRLYFTPNYIYSGTSEFLDCVDLKTGELLWEENTTALTGASNVPSFGYYYSDDTPNEHGIQNPGWLFASNYRIGYEPLKGFPYLNITGVPTGFEIQGKAGENLRYVLTNKGNTTNPSYYLSQWNSSKTIPGQGLTANIDGSLASRFDWNVSSPIQFSTAPTVRAASLTSNILWGSNGSWPSGTSSPSYAYPDSVTVWAISIDPANPGKLISMSTIKTETSDFENIIFQRADAKEGIFVALEVPSCTFHAYDMRTGNQLWETDAQVNLNPYGYYTWPSLISGSQTKMAYGMLFTGGYTGGVSAYYLTNGSLAWRRMYPTGAEKINGYTAMIALIADGKIYVGTHEHSADTPMYKGMHVRALNVTNGDTVWEMSGWAYPEAVYEADGVLIYWNNYDGQIYAVGKGPTAMTVTAPNTASPLGTPLVIRGTVVDVSAGTQQQAPKANFPYGVPAVSDASQAQWMEYVYMQKGKPTNATGVPVKIDVIDSNGNFRTIGTTTSDSSGMFTLSWKPDITGSYTVIASFAGSESYWPTSAETSFYASEPVATPAPTQALAQSTSDLYFVSAVAGIIVAIAIVVALQVLILLKKRP
jgi:hypothetical protein